MIKLVTGTPGAGKTSNTLWDFLFNPAYKDRPKFATAINGFDYEGQGVTLLDDIEGWRDLPPGALVLVDEADRFIPAKAKGEMPDWIRELARSRHYGIDFIFITQLHSMIHHHVRGLIDSHIHYHRAWGLASTSSFRWEHLQTNVNSLQARNLAQKKRVRVNKKIFTIYKSTQLDTERPQLPWKWLITAFLAVVVIAAAGFYVRHFFTAKASADPKPASSPALIQPGQKVAGAGVLVFQSPASSSAPIKISDYYPRVVIDPSTAPIYDDLTKPSDFPRVAACIASKTTCKCSTQQATPTYVPQDICRQMVAQGWFDKWKTARAQSEQVLSGRPDESVSRDMIAAQQQRPESIVIGDQVADSSFRGKPYESIYAKH